MSNEEIKVEIGYFISDIKNHVNNNDFKSAAQISRALSKFLNDVKRFK